MAQSSHESNARFSDFSVSKTTYKTVGDHEISTHVLIPKKLISQPNQSQKYPVLLRFHGGGLIAASSIFPDWFPSWALELALRHSAIIVSPNHRLLPESSVDDILEDTEDLWAWVNEQLPAFVSEQTKDAVHVDTSRIMTAGDSAGGYLSFYLGLSHPDKIKAVTAAYPMLDLKSDHFRTRTEGPLGFMDYIPTKVYEEHMDKVNNGQLPAIVSEDDFLGRIPLMFCSIQNGLYAEFFPLDRRELFILDRIQDGQKLPRGGVFFWHGKDDSVVPAEGSKKLLDILQTVDPTLNARLEIRDGDHGFDGEAKLDDEWFANGLKDLVAAWLG